MIRPGVVAVIAASFLLGGCGTPRPEPLRQGHTEAFAATALVRAVPEGGEPIQVSTHAWRGRDGTLKVLVTKAEVDVLVAHLDPGGRLRLWSPRQHEVSDTRLTDPSLPTLLARLPLLVSELTEGPIPSSATVAADGTFRATDADLIVSVAGTADRPTTKTLTTADGEVLLTIAYGEPKPFDALVRPSRWTATTAGGEALVILRRFDALGDVSPERLRWDDPADAASVPPAVLLDHLNR